MFNIYHIYSIGRSCAFIENQVVFTSINFFNVCRDTFNQDQDLPGINCDKTINDIGVILIYFTLYDNIHFVGSYKYFIQYH